ncbi:Syntaxin F55A11.2, putative [Brugia malayi]|uniref:BMA-SYX-5, isoform b n=1 Tax=Brugia malayi TaxID=6279 RepID=A0A0J9Y9W2_BRUMA|nr:Syntaxin F55A11.2, putative [Brugia malayi]CDQ04727.1 BMA-SYX-5, isoform b [Brugia malayi]VIO99567.1 Syntaxin F55A11.2, putative [Brugia malayi]
MHVNETELPLTVTRRRVTTSGISVKSDVNHIPSEDVIKSKGSPFSSFANLSSSLWSSAQHTFSGTTDTSPFFGYYGNNSTNSECEQNSSISFIKATEEMPSRDRTGEFRTTAKSYQMKMYGAGGYTPREPRIQQSVQFAQLAKRIGRDLSLTCAKMEKLTELAKRRSLFDDRMAEVGELSQVIKHDITGLNKQIAVLQEFSKNNSNFNKKDQKHGHSQLIVVGLQSKLASVSKDFQNVLELRTENLKQQKSRREKFSQGHPVPSSLPPSVSSGNLGSVLFQDEIKASSSVAIDINMLEQQRLQQQVSLINEQDAYLQARSSAMDNIESSISELGQIFRQLASLVTEQGEMITRIDSNVEETSLNVEAAHTELVKYFHSISQNRWLIIKVFGVLFFFFVIFIVFLS